MTKPRKKTASRAKQAITITMAPPLLREVDAYARRVERPRGQVIEMACRKYLAERAAAPATTEPVDAAA